MSDCMYLPKCDFYQNRLDNMPATAEFMKIEYCLKSPGACARLVYRLNNFNNNIPNDLMPHEIAKLKII